MSADQGAASTARATVTEARSDTIGVVVPIAIGVAIRVVAITTAVAIMVVGLTDHIGVATTAANAGRAGWLAE